MINGRRSVGNTFVVFSNALLERFLAPFGNTVTKVDPFRRIKHRKASLAVVETEECEHNLILTRIRDYYWQWRTHRPIYGCRDRFTRGRPRAAGRTVSSRELWSESGIECYPSAAAMAENGDRSRKSKNGG